MTSDKLPAHSSPPAYDPNDTTPPPAYSRNNVDLGFLRRPQPARSMLDVGVKLQQTSRPIRWARPVRPAEPIRWPRAVSQLERVHPMFDISEPLQQRAQSSSDTREDSGQPPPQPVRTFRSMLDVGDEFHQPQPTVPRQCRHESPADLEAEQEIITEDGPIVPTMQRQVVIVTTFCTEFVLICLFFVLWTTMRQQISRLFWFPTLAGSPYFLLVVGLSRSRTCHPKFRKSFIIKTILITLFHCFCGLAMAIFGAWIQYKYNVL